MGNSGELARCLRVAILKGGARVVARQEKSVYCKEEGTSGVRRSWMRLELIAGATVAIVRQRAGPATPSW